eukprot:gene5230-9406_t
MTVAGYKALIICIGCITTAATTETLTLPTTLYAFTVVPTSPPASAVPS